MGQSGSFRDSDFPDLVLRVDAERVEDGFNIFAVDTKGGGGYSKMSIKFLFNFRPADPKVCSGHMSMAICGSKFCIIGAGFDMEINKFPREFVQYDLTDWRNKNDFKPDDDVPKPIGSKPRPAVFVHQHRLYALAGMSYCTPLVNVPDIPDPAFEVYDPYHAPPCWKKLEDPPFMEYYNKATVHRRFLWGHKVVGTTLYVLLRGGSFPKDVYYTYSITDHEWKKIIVDKSDTFLANMTVYGHYCEWEAREDFVDLMGFHYNGKKVLAHDLRAPVDQSMIRKKHNVRVSAYDDYYVEHEYPFLVVHDLEEVKDSDGFVAHLADNIFCAVYFSMFEGKCRIHAVKFELRKEYKEGCDLVDTLSAKILESADHSFGDRRSFGTCDQWGKLYSKCLRPNGYTDGVVMNDNREAREDFVDLMSFHYNGKKVLAHDLTAQVDESKLRKNHNVEDEYPFLVVHGLEDVKEPHSHGFVAHLAGNIFCAVYFTRVRDKYYINAIKFELCKKYKEGCDLVDTLSANILDSADYFMGDKRSFGPCKTMGQVVLYISVPQRLYTDDAVMNGKTIHGRVKNEL